MERDDNRDSKALRLRRAAKRCRRDNANMAVRDVESLALEHIANRAHATGRDQESKLRRKRRVDAMNANAINMLLAWRRRNDMHVMPNRDEPLGEILKV